MTDDDDDLMFQDDSVGEPARPALSNVRWKMLVVDDEPEVHSITRLVLADFSFRGRAIQFLSAYSATEAIAILEREKDIAVILLDVVMETDDAGLRLVHHIREVMGNRYVRIILRTGQPGQAPERNVILEYDINDYKSKTQLTAQQLFTCTVAALRSYEDLIAIDANRRGLEKIIEASSSLFKTRSLKLFAAGVLTQLSAIVGAGPEAILCVQRGDFRRRDRDRLYVLAGSGRFESLIDEPLDGCVNADIVEVIHRCLTERQSQFTPSHCVMYIHTLSERENVVFLRSDQPLSKLDQRLIALFCDKMSVGFENIYLYEQLLKAQEATVATLADLTESGQSECKEDTGVDGGYEGEKHQQKLRIAAISKQIAHQLHAERQFQGVINEPFLELIGLASVLHDVGNIVVPNRILQKPSRLEVKERRTMERHTVRGSTLLLQACRTIEGLNYLELGAEIARHHHENFDGTGYPDGLVAEHIPLAARIVAVADTFDALLSDRPYRPAWPREAAIAEIEKLSGYRFDPVVVAAFLKIVIR